MQSAANFVDEAGYGKVVWMSSSMGAFVKSVFWA